MRPPQPSPFVAPQEVNETDWLAIAKYAYQFRHTFTASAGDAATVLGAGNADSYAKIVRPSLPSQQNTIQHLEANGIKWINVTSQVFPGEVG